MTAADDSSRSSGEAFADPDGELAGTGLACQRGERLVFGGLSCRVAAGGALILAGANGSGKSSLLRLLATLLAPAAGVLAWGGVPVGRDLPGYRARLHYVGHLDAIKPALTPREMLAFWTISRGAVRSRKQAADGPGLDAALAVFGLEALADWPCRWLSAGQRRRLALARLIAAPAPLWLLDEPTAGLDRSSQECLEQAIAVHRLRGGRVILATHQPLAISEAATLVLDDFAPAPGDRAAIAGAF